MKAEYFGGACIVIAAIIGVFSYNLNSDKIKTQSAETISQTEDTTPQPTETTIEPTEIVDMEVVTNLESKLAEADEKYEKLDKLYVDLLAVNQSLESEIEDLKSTNTELTEQNSLLSQKSESLMQALEDKNSEPVTAVAESLSSDNEKYVIELTPFTGDLKLREQYSMTDNLGNEHKKVFVTGYLTESVFKINGEYSRISGLLFQNFEQRSSDVTSKLRITGDGKLIFETKVGAGIEPIEFSEDISGVNELTIRFLSPSSGGGVNRAGIADFKLTK